MANTLLGFASHDWAGLAVGVVLALFALWLVRTTRGWRRASGVAAAAIAAVLALGGLYHVVHMGGIARANPPPGTLVDVGGYRMHVLAEGDPHGLATIVWLAGAHEAGLALYHLHAGIRGEARSILIDRPGAGWSDAGPFPRTTATESEEVVTALKRLGEKGPFVFAGHSFGGLLAANIARRHPEIVSAVVLLDATPPDTITYISPNPYLPAMRREALWTGLERLFGLHHDTVARLSGKDPDTEARRVGGLMAERLGPELERMASIEDGSKAAFADYSIFAEILPGGIGWDNIVYDGELGALPVYLVAPHGLPNFDAFASVMYAAGGPGLGPEAAYRERLRQFADRSRERYLHVADHVERVDAPAGSSHNFIYERVDFVLDTVRRVLREHPPAERR